MADPFNVVYFLGAGFAKAWGLPVMNDFFEHARFSSRLQREDVEFLDTLRALARQAVSMLQISHNNLEDILSLCQMGGAIDNELRDSRDTVPTEAKFRAIVGRIYSEMGDDHFLLSDFAVRTAQRVFGLGEREEHKSRWREQATTILTTNYDVYAESVCFLSAKKARLPVQWRSMVPDRPMGTDLYGNPNGDGPLLCKLHGSVNMFLGANDSWLACEERLELARKYVNGKSCPLPHCCDPKYVPPGPPLIVPPTLFKAQTNPFIRQMWRSAQKALSDADRLIFIGYSFPPSDIHMRYFFAAHLMMNMRLNEIFVVDPAADFIVDRLKQSELGSHFKQMLRPVVAKWEQVNWEVTRRGVVPMG